MAELVSVNSTKKQPSNMMKKIIEKHQKIICFTEKIENLYTFVALMQFVTNVVMICTLGFLMITVSKTVNYNSKPNRNVHECMCVK